MIQVSKTRKEDRSKAESSPVPSGTMDTGEGWSSDVSQHVKCEEGVAYQ